MRFLADGQILQAVRQLADSNKELLAAVAFWGRGAGQKTGITERTAPTRILCDLLSGACNPDEIRLLQKKGAEVKYRPQLHAKVWLNGDQVVVGSANASMNGLGFQTAGSNIEAAVYFCDKAMANEARKWFKREWSKAQAVDENLLQRAQNSWNRKQNTGNAIMRCRITAYENSDLSPEARRMFDQIAPKIYSNEEIAKFHRDALAHGGHPADDTCYENGNNYLPNLGTVFMDYSRDPTLDENVDANNFEFTGFWEVLRNKRLANGDTLSFLRKRDGRAFPMRQVTGGRRAIDDMVNTYLQQTGLVELDMIFAVFYALQEDM